MNRSLLAILSCCTILGAPLLGQTSFIWNTPCEDQKVCLNFNSCTAANVFVTQSAWSSCGAGVGINYSYRVDYNSDGSIEVNSAADTLTGTLGKGVHRVYWRATDQCGRNLTCSHTITVEDCQPPNLICTSGLTIGINEPNCGDKLAAKRFILNLSDNCSPTDKIQLGIRKVGEGTGFPTTDTVAFDRCNIGVNLLEVWARDEKGRSNQCNTYVLLQANSGACVCVRDANVRLKGCTRAANNKKLGNYQIQTRFQNEPGAEPTYSKVFSQNVATDSCFTATLPKVPLGGPFRATVWAKKAGAALDGVTTLDLALISKHILGIDTFKTIYQTLAADVNRSNTVTTFDVVEARKVILGIYDSFPGITAWQMIRPVVTPAYTLNFAALRDTYQVVIPPISTAEVNVARNFNFVAVKMGDVNYSAQPNLQESAVEDRAALPVRMEDRVLNPGVSYRVPLSWGDAGQLDAWQLALGFDPALLRIEKVEGLPAENIALDGELGTLRALWFDTASKGVVEGTALMALMVRALRPVRLSEALWLDGVAMSPEAYTLPAQGPATRWPLGLHFEGAADPTQTWVATPQPNPFANETVFRYQLAQAQPLRLDVVDAAGRAVYAAQRDCSEGVGEWRLSQEDLRSEGLLFYRLSAGGRVWMGKMVRVE